MNAIEANELKKVFPNGVEAVAGIDLEVREGDIVGFLGPNGAGKTTTTRILTTLLRPTSGSARVGGHDVLADPHEVRRAVGVALQEAGLDALATGRELLILQARLYGFRGTEPTKRADRLLELVGLTDAADRRIKTYSGGMKRRLDLASALIHGPRILFLDEPTAGLDPASRQAVLDEVRRLNREGGITVFLTTQYLEEADRMADHLAIIDHGRIVARGTPEELKGSIGSDIVTVEVPREDVHRAESALSALPGLKEVQREESAITLFVSDGSGAAARVIQLLVEAAVPVGSVKLSSPTLDEVFLRATGSRLEGAGALAGNGQRGKP
ncbi:MAG: ATP-binding cassette domain-containing protein [Actinobacteria bacterium]|nr:MAG: ATP-binding cassette domain-containing protein [Actinomycetota bacterium]